jgi:hypothetical protein
LGLISGFNFWGLIYDALAESQSAQEVMVATTQVKNLSGYKI